MHYYAVAFRQARQERDFGETSAPQQPQAGPSKKDGFGALSFDNRLYNLADDALNLKKPAPKELNDLKLETADLRKYYQMHERKDVDAIVRLIMSMENCISSMDMAGLKKAAAELKMIQVLGELETTFQDPSKIGSDPMKAAAVRSYCAEIAALGKHVSPALREKAEGFSEWVGTEYVDYSRKLDGWFVKNPKSGRMNAEKTRKVSEDRKAKTAFGILYSSLKEEVMSSYEMPASELQRRMDRVYASAEATDRGLNGALDNLDFGDHLLNSSWLDLLKTSALLNRGIYIGEIGNEKIRGVYKTAGDCEKNYKEFKQCYLDFKSALQGGDQAELSESVGKLSQTYLALSYAQAKLAVLVEDYDLKGFEYVMPALSKAMDVMMAVSLATGVGAVATLGRAGLKAALLETGEYMLEQGMTSSLKMTFAFFVPETISGAISSSNLAEAEQIAQTNQLAGLHALSSALQKARGGRKGAKNAGGISQAIDDVNRAASDLEAKLQSNPGYRLDPEELSKNFLMSYGQMLLFESGFGLMRSAKVFALRSAGRAPKLELSPAEKGDAAHGKTEEQSRRPSAGKSTEPEMKLPQTEEFRQAKEIADAKEAAGDFAGAGAAWKDAAIAAKSPAEAMEMCKMAEAAYRKAGEPLEAAGAYFAVTLENPAVADGKGILDWARFRKTAFDISESLGRHEKAGTGFANLAQTIMEHLDANESMPKREIVELRSLENECRFKAAENFERDGQFWNAGRQYEMSAAKKMSKGESAERMKKAAVCYEKANEHVAAADAWKERRRFLAPEDQVAIVEARGKEFANVLAAIGGLREKAGTWEQSATNMPLSDLELRASWLEADPLKAGEFAKSALADAQAGQYGSGVSASYGRLGALASEPAIKLGYFDSAVETALKGSTRGNELAAYMKLPDQVRIGICEAAASNRKVGMLRDYADCLKITCETIERLDALRPAQGAAGRKGATVELFEKQGIRNFGRYDAEFLAMQYDKMGTRQAGKPLLLVIYPEGDHNGSFMGGFAEIARMEKDFDVRLTEAGTAYGAGRRVVDTGAKYGRISALIIGGHGDGKVVDLGKETVTADMIAKGPDYTRYFTEAPSFITISCFGAKRGGPAPAAFARYPTATAFGPVRETTMPDIEWKIDVEGKPLFNFKWGGKAPDGAVYGRQGAENTFRPAENVAQAAGKKPESGQFGTERGQPQGKTVASDAAMHAKTLEDILLLEASALKMEGKDAAGIIEGISKFIGTAQGELDAQGFITPKNKKELMSITEQALSMVWSEFSQADHRSLVEALKAKSLDCDASSIVIAQLLSNFGVECSLVELPWHVILKLKAGDATFYLETTPKSKLKIYDTLDDLKASYPVVYGEYPFGTENPMIYTIIADLRSSVGDHEGAMHYYDLAIESNPNSPNTYNNRGAERSEHGDNEGALSDYQAGLKIDPGHMDLNFNFGEAEFKKGHFAEAERALAKAIKNYKAEKNPAFAENIQEALYMHGKSWLELGHKEWALDDFNEAIGMGMKTSDMYYSRGKLNVSIENYGAAIEDYGKAIELDPKNIDVYFSRASLRLIKEKNYAGALSDYDAILKLDPSNQKARGYADALRQDYPELSKPPATTPPKTQAPKAGTGIASPLQIRREFVSAGSVALADYMINEVKVSGVPAAKLGRFAALVQKYETRYPDLAPDEKRPEPSLGGLMESYAKWEGKNKGKDIVEFMEVLEGTKLPHKIVCRMDEINEEIGKNFGTEIKPGAPVAAFEGTAAVYKVDCTDGTKLMLKLADVSVEAAAAEVFARLGFDPKYRIVGCGDFGLMTVAPGMTVKELFKNGQFRSLRLEDIEAGGDPAKRDNFLASMAEWQAVQWACKLGDSHPRNYMVDETGWATRIDYDKTGRDDPNFLTSLDMNFDFGFGRGTASMEERALFENAFKGAWAKMQANLAQDNGLQAACMNHSAASKGQFPGDFYQGLQGTLGRSAEDVWQEFSASREERRNR